MFIGPTQDFGQVPQVLVTVGVSVPQPNGGRAIVVCMPPGGAVPPVGPGTVAGSAAKFVTNIYRHLGLDQP